MNRTNLINLLISKYDYKSYLEIGLYNGKNFAQIKAKDKTSVDPDLRMKATFKMGSDEFFKQNKKTFDIIFIDGLHEHNQVDRDIENSLKFLNEGGTIVLHDCNPIQELHQRVPKESITWNGDVWKSIVKFRKKSKIGCVVLNFDHGCGLIGSRIPYTPLDLEYKLNYNWLVENRVKALNLIDNFELLS